MYELASVLDVVMVVRPGLRRPETSAIERRTDEVSSSDAGQADLSGDAVADGQRVAVLFFVSRVQHKGLDPVGVFKASACGSIGAVLLALWQLLVVV